MKIYISLIIPVFNAEKSLNELCSRIIFVFETQIKFDFEIILVNDASKDSSWEIMKQLNSKDSRIKVIDLAKNSGQHAAMHCGLQHFKGDYVLFMDDDLQHPPEEIPKLVRHIIENPDIDVVIGAFAEKKHSLIRNAGSKAMQIAGKKIFKKETSLRFTNFRIMRADIAQAIAKIHINKPRIGQLILHTTRNISSIVVEHDERKYGKSGYTFTRLVKDFILNIINNSALPLKLISSMGLIISIISFFIGLFYLLRYMIHGTSVAGWTSLIVITTLLSGFILFSLGIIGEYLIRILTEAKKLPNYLEREKHF
jgi:polyisoprenyl-phosphate glycosyltransferase